MIEETREASAKINIQRMTPNLVDEVYALGLETPQLGTDTEAPQMYSKEALLRAINDPDHIMLVAIDKGQLVGFSITGIDRALRDAEIHELAIKTEYRKGGVGSQLLEETLHFLEEKTEVNHVVSHVQVENVPMQEFLQKRKFQKGRNFTWMEIMLPKAKK